MSLEANIAERAREIHADGYAMSIGEVANMYRDGDLEIHPEFQRIFRWTLTQQSRLVESIFLGIPIPAIFVAQRDDGVWDVVDGVQRLSTILRFMGVLRDSDGAVDAPEKLLATEYLPTLGGIVWEGEDENALTPALRRDFKRAKLEFRIIKKESDPNARFDLFQRLNSGTHLSEQEARNCLVVMLDSSLFHWLTELAARPEFVETALLTERKEQEQYNVELVLRFLVGVTRNEEHLRAEMTDVSSYLDKFVVALAGESEKWRGELGEAFVATFGILQHVIGENAFRRWNVEQGKHMGGFSISAFEVAAWGVAANLDYWQRATDENAVADDLRSRIQSIWGNHDFQKKTGSGIRGSTRMPNTLALSKEVLHLESGNCRAIR